MRQWLLLLAWIPAVSFTASGPLQSDSVPPLTLSGTVSETAPTASTRIANATVTIVDGSHAGRSASTDGDGAFHLPSLYPGTIRINVQAAGYIEESRSIPLAVNRVFDFALSPVFK